MMVFVKLRHSMTDFKTLQTFKSNLISYNVVSAELSSFDLEIISNFLNKLDIEGNFLLVAELLLFLDRFLLIGHQISTSP